jgi:hypothetical protein
MPRENAEDRERKAEQREWLRETRRDMREDLKDTFREDKQHRREFKEPLWGGVRIIIGPSCEAAADRHGAYVPLDVAIKNPDLLPPYDGICEFDSCECRIESVSATEIVPTGLKVLNADGTWYRTKKSGCFSVLLLAAIVGIAFLKLM